MSGPNAPGKRRKRVVLNCLRKVPHATKAEAEIAMEEVRAAGKLYSENPSAYVCPVCQLWHWGRPPTDGVGPLQHIGSTKIEWGVLPIGYGSVYIREAVEGMVPTLIGPVSETLAPAVIEERKRLLLAAIARANKAMKS